MATKWKNTINKIDTAIHTKEVKTIFGSIICGIIGIILAFYIPVKLYWLYRSTLWILSLIGDLFLGLGCFFFYRLYLCRSYERQSAQKDYTYENWNTQSSAWQSQIFKIAFILLSADFIYLYLLINNHSLHYYGGFDIIYMVALTALAIFAVLESAFLSFTKKQLDMLMERTEEENKKIINAAIAAEKESIAAAIKSEQLKVDLISNVSHDLKTPLTSMIGYIDLMKKEDLSDTLADYVEVLSNKSLKLKEMVESLFSLAKTSSGNIKLHPESLSLNRMVEQIYADMEDKITASDLEFVTELTAADTKLVTDSSYLYRICQNLVENTLKYSAAHTRVFLKTISTSNETGRTVCFEITNTAGYRMNFTKDQIVERFARGEESRTGDGNGLGLAIVNTYTAALGGQFDVSIDCDQFKATVSFKNQPISY